jgi:hypothetical protein
MYLSETDKVNNLTKLARHRIAARALALNPGLVGHALKAIDQVQEKSGYVPAHDEWRVLLARPVDEVRTALTARNETMDRLRIDSPFFRLFDHGLDFTDERERRRIWWIAKRVAGISTRDEQWIRPDEYEAARQTWWGYYRPVAAKLDRDLDLEPIYDHDDGDDELVAAPAM